MSIIQYTQYTLQINYNLHRFKQHLVPTYIVSYINIGIPTKYLRQINYYATYRSLQGVTLKFCLPLN